MSLEFAYYGRRENFYGRSSETSHALGWLSFRHNCSSYCDRAREVR